MRRKILLLRGVGKGRKNGKRKKNIEEGKRTEYIMWGKE
jgi:hypothetical protein